MTIQRAPKHSEDRAGRPEAKRPEGVLSERRAIDSPSVIRFQVHGLPIPQGSQRSWLVNGKPVITSSAKGLASWRRLVADVAQRFAPEQPWEGPVEISLDFGIPKPKSAPKTKRVWPDKRPDVDKLCRAVFDALTYVIFADDSQVIKLEATKDYGAPGVAVEIRRVSDDGALDI
ncbi:MAG TPA: RusA family crossover junction endodeoxyribonuclease [Thermoplasmata archaeon]|nr:RusA family crossover junction endodeoxyribonuclease [Thermoplasmata archaeon]